MDSEFSFDKQKLLVEYMMSSPDIFQRCRNILKPTFFDKELEKVVAVILEHANNYNNVPTTDQLKAECGFSIRSDHNLRDQDTDYTLDNIERFCKRAAVIEAVLKAPDSIEIGDYGSVLKEVQEALEVGLQKDLGTQYFKDPRERLERMKQHDLIPTGYYEIDKKLYGGLNRGEVTLFTAGSGMGKSLMLQNICLNWAEGAKYRWGDQEKVYKPLNVVYITLELSEELVSKRMDTMVTSIDAREIFKKIDDVELKVRLKGKQCGDLHIKYMPAGSTCMDIRAYLKEFEIKFGYKPDALAIDYLDLLHPGSVKVSAADLFIKDKFVTEEMRAMAAEWDVLCVSASQLNRSAVDESEHSQAMIAGGISKIQTADNVCSLYASAAMRERGEYMVNFLKTRSSSGVGSKVYVGFDQTSLRIVNLDDDYVTSEGTTSDPNPISDKAMKSTSPMGKSNNSILNAIKSGPKTPQSESLDDQEDSAPVAESPIERMKRLKASGVIK